MSTFVAIIVKAVLEVLIKNIPTFLRYWDNWRTRRNRVRAADAQNTADEQAIKKAIEEANK